MGAVFDADTEGGEFVADAIAGGEVFGCTRLLALFEEGFDACGGLVADTATAQELIGDDPRQNLVKAFVKRIAHGDT